MASLYFYYDTLEDAGSSLTFIEQILINAHITPEEYFFDIHYVPHSSEYGITVKLNEIEDIMSLHDAAEHTLPANYDGYDVAVDN